MYKIDREGNSISALERKRFSDLNFRERDHLQEWLAKEPSSLGEELLIIQKEFSGFGGTNERLDLLALDMQGRLVIIENKLDDSGRDVIWQALKYAAYCSTLSTDQIIDIYQKYLGSSSREDAKSKVAEFLDDSDPEELTLNPLNSQRIILVAANFRKEITSTSLWLLAKGVRISCFQVTPYQSGDDLLLDISQLIPTPETGEYIIQLADKAASDEKTSSSDIARHKKRHDYWVAALLELEKSNVTLFQRKSPSRDNWLSVGSGLANCTYGLIFNKDQAKVQFYFGRGDKNENKALFDRLMENKVQIEKAFGAQLEWKRLDNSKSSHITFSAPFDSSDRENWGEIIKWHIENVNNLERSISPYIEELKTVAQNYGDI